MKPMKLLSHVITTACVLIAAVADASDKPIAKPITDAEKSAEPAAPVYETAKDITAMPRCKATVMHTYPCYSLLQTTDGKKFCIGSPGATLEVANFVETLKDGQTYELPVAFLTYQTTKPR